jgi:hypothetical protein
MSKMIYIKFLIYSCLIMSAFSSQDSKDPEFQQEYKVRYLAEGDGKAFPAKGQSVKVHYT